MVFWSSTSLQTATATDVQAAGKSALLTVTGYTPDGAPLVGSPRESSRDLFLAGQEPNKRVAHVGNRNGDYAQVQTFRYVGPGAGQFNVLARERPDHREETEIEIGRAPAPPNHASLFTAAIVSVTCVLCLLWVVWPEDGALGLKSVEEWSHASEVVSVVPRSIAKAVSWNSQSFTGFQDGGKQTTMGGAGGIDFSMRFGDLDLEMVTTQVKLQEGFAMAIQEAVTFYAGHGIGTDRVCVTIVPEEGLVHTEIIPPCRIDAIKLQAKLNFTSLARAVQANLETMNQFSGNRLDVRILDGESFVAECDIEGAKRVLQQRKEHREVQRTDQGEQEKENAIVDACQVLVIRGADPPSASRVNGVYTVRGVKFNGQLLFQKRYTPDLWVAFIQGRWYVTDNQRKNDNVGGGWMYSEDSKGDTPGEVELWSEWDGTKWSQKPAITVSCSKAFGFRTSNMWCSNWKQIQLGPGSVEQTSEECGRRCRNARGCAGFNYVDRDACPKDAHFHGMIGNCTLWDGPCQGVRKVCHTDFVVT